MLQISPLRAVGHHDRGNNLQPSDDLARFVEPSRMDIAGCEMALNVCIARQRLQSGEECRYSLIEPAL
jgi:hypothetical protein